VSSFSSKTSKKSSSKFDGVIVELHLFLLALFGARKTLLQVLLDVLARKEQEQDAEQQRRERRDEDVERISEPEVFRLVTLSRKCHRCSTQVGEAKRTAY